MLRFVSSPTGDMHIDELRVALLNYIVSKQKNEDLIVRINDMDKENNIEGKDQETLDILDLFGIKYSQVIYQSQNVRFHSAMALQLLHEKRAFSCFCSDAWLQKKRNESKEANEEYHYDDACRNLPPELVIDNTAPFCVRIIRPDKPVVFKDYIQGQVSFEPDRIDSFIIMNQDKTPTYNFASAVDDMLTDISTIITTIEDISNTAKQAYVRNRLSYEKILEYVHLPTITNGNISVKQLLKEGYLPEAISNYLISIGNIPSKEIFTLNEAVEWFTLEAIKNSTVSFNIDTLKRINKEHLKKLDPKELSRYVGFADTEIGELARIYLEEVDTTKELKEKIAQIFAPRNIPKQFHVQAVAITKIIQSAPYFEEFEDFQNYIIKETKLQKDELHKPLQLLLVNAQTGPEIEKVYKYLKNYIKEIVK